MDSTLELGRVSEATKASYVFGQIADGIAGTHPVDGRCVLLKVFEDLNAPAEDC